MLLEEWLPKLKRPPALVFLIAEGVLCDQTRQEEVCIAIFVFSYELMMMMMMMTENEKKQVRKGEFIYLLKKSSIFISSF